MKIFKNLKYIGLIALAVSFTACNDEEDFEEFLDQPPVAEVALTSGSADFSNYVSLGASFTAGFSDGALFMAGQENSFPNTLAKQFANANGGNFTQPLTADNFGGLAVGGTRIQDPRLVFGGTGPVPLEGVIGTVTVGTDLLSPPTGPFSNLGVPGLKSFHLLAPGYGNLGNLASGAANPYATRLTGSTPNASIMELALAQNPTFFTLSEIGGNDVLSYATSGGTGVDQTGNFDPSTYGGSDITDPNVFAGVFSSTVDALTLNGAKGVVANVPYITDLAHFTTVPHNPIPLDAATAGFLNSASAYGAYNAGIVAAFAYVVATTPMTQAQADAEIAKRTIVFAAGEGNAVVIMDESLTDLTGLSAALVSMRQATAADLIVLPASNIIGTEAIPGNPTTVNGVAIPLADKWALTPEEQLEIKTATDAYNVTIASVASAKGLALVDFNTILNQASSSAGIPFDDYNMNTNLVTGGLISLDGIHLTARGYALMANAFLDAIDTTYGSNFRASGNVARADAFSVNYSPLLQ